MLPDEIKLNTLIEVEISSNRISNYWPAYEWLYTLGAPQRDLYYFFYNEMTNPDEKYKLLDWITKKGEAGVVGKWPLRFAK